VATLLLLPEAPAHLRAVWHLCLRVHRPQHLLHRTPLLLPQVRVESQGIQKERIHTPSFRRVLHLAQLHLESTQEKRGLVRG